MGFRLTKNLVGVVLSQGPASMSKSFSTWDPWTWLLAALLEGVGVSTEHTQPSASSHKPSYCYDPWSNCSMVPGSQECTEHYWPCWFVSRWAPRLLWNCGETGFCSAQACHKVLTKWGDKDVKDTLGGSGREYCTVLGPGPLVVYDFLHTLRTKARTCGADGCMVGQLEVYTLSPTVGGWSQQTSGGGWRCFCQLSSTSQSIIQCWWSLTVITPPRADRASSSQQHPLALPSHSTHLLQPLDVGVFSPVKAKWKILEGAPNCDVCCKCDQGGLSRPNCAALGQVLQPRSSHKWLSKDGLVSQDAIPTIVMRSPSI